MEAILPLIAPLAGLIAVAMAARVTLRDRGSDAAAAVREIAALREAIVKLTTQIIHVEAHNAQCHNDRIDLDHRVGAVELALAKHSGRMEAGSRIETASPRIKPPR